MNIIYIVPLGGIGGAEKIAYSLASHFSKKHNISMVFLKGPLDESFLVNDGIKKHVLDMYSFKDIPKALVQLFKIFKYEKPDIVHTHVFYSHVVARVLKPFFDFKLICSEHGSITSIANLPAYQKTVNVILKNKSDFNTNVCNEAVKTYIDAGYYAENEIFCVYNGLNENKFIDYLDIDYLKKYFNFEENTKIYLAVGRLSNEKNFQMLIKAFQKIIIKYKIKSKLLIAGDGDLREELELLVTKLKLTNDVVFLGKRNDIPELMHFSDIYCLSSNFEGLPTVLIEAVFSKMDIVSTRCCGVEEILGNLDASSNIGDIEEFSENMYKTAIYSDSSLINKRYIRAKKLFTQESMLSFWEDKYNELKK